MADLKGFRVAVLATDGVEQVELTRPVEALREAGATVHVVSPKDGSILGFKHFDHGDQIPVDRSLDEVNPGEYDGLFLPGGALNADHMRINDRAQFFVRAFRDSGKPIAVICHAPWLLISAKVVKGKRLTSYETIQDDLKNAGADWVDQPVVVDGELVTSRKPDDIPDFNREMLALFEKAKSRAPKAA